MSKRYIGKKIYGCMLVDNTIATESVRVTVSEFGIICASIRSECLRRRIRRVSNQHVTDTINVYILRHLLRGRSNYWCALSAKMLVPNIDIINNNISNKDKKILR